MNCHVAFDTILSYALGELDEGSAREVEAHLASCPQCGREFEAARALASGLEDLPKIQPDPRLWSALERSLEEGGAGRAGLASAVLGFLKRPVAVGSAAALAACAVLLLWTMTRESTPPSSGVSVVEMGSKFARRSLARQDLHDAVTAFLDDARGIITDAAECAGAGDAERWRALKERAAASDMLYRALYLGERLEGMSEPEQIRRRALIADSADLFRFIGERSPEALAAGRQEVEREIARVDLLRRLQKEGSR